MLRSPHQKTFFGKNSVDLAEVSLGQKSKVSARNLNEHLILVANPAGNLWAKGRKGPNLGAGCLRVHKGTNLQYGSSLRQRLYGFGVNDTGPIKGQLDGLPVGHLLKEDGSLKNLRVGAEHAGNVLPDAQNLGLERLSKHRRAVVGTFTPQGRGALVGRGTYKTLGDAYLCRICEGLDHGGLGLGPINAGPSVGRVGSKDPSCVQPVGVAAVGAQGSCKEERRGDFAQRNRCIVARIVGLLRIHLVGLDPQGLKLVAELRVEQAQLLGNALVKARDLEEFALSLFMLAQLAGLNESLESVRRFAHGRNHHEQGGLAVVANQPNRVAQGPGVFDRGATKLKYRPIRKHNEGIEGGS